MDDLFDCKGHITDTTFDHHFVGDTGHCLNQRADLISLASRRDHQHPSCILRANVHLQGLALEGFRVDGEEGVRRANGSRARRLLNLLKAANGSRG